MRIACAKKYSYTSNPAKECTFFSTFFSTAHFLSALRVEGTTAG